MVNSGLEELNSHNALNIHFEALKKCLISYT